MTSARVRVSTITTLTTCLTDLEDLLLLEREPIKRGSKESKSPYNRERYFGYAQDTKVAFGKLYTFCFTLAKQG
jgi:DCN1-like protein 4/5